MSHNLKSLKALNRGLYRRLLLGILRGILGVYTIAHLAYGICFFIEGTLGFLGL